jgi:hypothetical protein
MKKVTLWMMALAALPGPALQAQNITGNWQGTLQVGQQKRRIVFKIALEMTSFRLRSIPSINRTRLSRPRSHGTVQP